jgi:hypothetical protein
MKKMLCLLLVALLVLPLAGCNPTKAYSYRELTMQVPEKAEDVSAAEENILFNFALESDTIFICGIRQDIAGMEAGQTMTAEDYAHQLMEDYQLEGYATHGERRGYVYIRFSVPLQDGVHQYLCGAYKSKEAFWLIQMDAKTADFDEEAFFDYLDSVKFS